MDIDPRDLSPRLPEMDPARKFAILVLLQGQEDGATELVIEQPDVGGQVPIRYMVSGTWYDMAPFPSSVRAHVAQAIMRLAGFPDSAQFPVDGDIDACVTEEVHLRWHVHVAAVDDPVRLRRPS